MRKAFTLIELMVGMVILALLMTALFRTFSAGQQTANEVMANHQINDEFDRALQKITEDVRESNDIYDNCPPILEKAQLANHKTEDPGNYLMFRKVIYDFTKDPMDLPAGTYNFTQIKFKYFLEKEDESDPNTTWVLNREMIPFNNKKELVESERTVYPILKGIQECVFYRLKDPDSSRSGCLYIRLKMTRNDKEGSSDEKYTNETVIAIKERGVPPE